MGKSMHDFDITVFLVGSHAKNLRRRCFQSYGQIICNYM